MLTGVELMQWIEQFGRWNVQEFVAKRQDMRDVLTYLKVERSLELAKVMPFVTSDSVSFERRHLSLRKAEICAEDGSHLNPIRISNVPTTFSGRI